MIDDDIRQLLAAPPSGKDAPSLDHIEHTLTAGYASALALEAERWRLEREIADVAAHLARGAGSDGTSELASLGQRLAVADGNLTRLRGLLTSLRTRAAEARASAV